MYSLIIGLPFELSFSSYFDDQSHIADNLNILSFDLSNTNAGFAPFAKYAEKMYSIDKMVDVMKEIAINGNRQIYLFGGGDDEKRKLQEWESKNPNVTSVVCMLTLENELLLMSNLSLVVSMDSAYMHLSSLVNTPVVSVWDATHPFLGFYGYSQDSKNAVQIELDCRPCSVLAMFLVGGATMHAWNE